LDRVRDQAGSEQGVSRGIGVGYRRGSERREVVMIAVVVVAVAEIYR
jgi:hypothetical protein